MKDIMITSLLVFTTFFVFVGFSFAFYMMLRLYLDIRNDSKESKGCVWLGKDDLLDQEYKTSCGKVFYDATESGEHVTDWIRYCPYCSKEVKKPS